MPVITQHNTLGRQLAVQENYGPSSTGGSGRAVALLSLGDIPDPQRKLARARSWRSSCARASG